MYTEPFRGMLYAGNTRLFLLLTDLPCLSAEFDHFEAREDIDWRHQTETVLPSSPRSLTILKSLDIDWRQAPNWKCPFQSFVTRRSLSIGLTLSWLYLTVLNMSHFRMYTDYMVSYKHLPFQSWPTTTRGQTYQASKGSREWLKQFRRWLKVTQSRTCEPRPGDLFK